MDSVRKKLMEQIVQGLIIGMQAEEGQKEKDFGTCLAFIAACYYCPHGSPLNTVLEIFTKFADKILVDCEECDLEDADRTI